MLIKRTPEQFAADRPCLICGAMDHEFFMMGGQKITVCPECPEPMLYISIPADWLTDTPPTRPGKLD